MARLAQWVPLVSLPGITMAVVFGCMFRWGVIYFSNMAERTR